MKTTVADHLKEISYLKEPSAQEMARLLSLPPEEGRRQLILQNKDLRSKLCTSEMRLWYKSYSRRVLEAEAEKLAAYVCAANTLGAICTHCSRNVAVDGHEVNCIVLSAEKILRIVRGA